APLPIFATSPSLGIKEEKEAAPSEQTIEEPIKKKEEALAEEPSGIAEETGDVLPHEQAMAGPGETGETAAGEQLSEKTEGKVVVPPNGVIVPAVDTPLPIFAEPPSSGKAEDTGEALPVKEKIPDVSEISGIAEKAAPHGEVHSEEAIQPLEKEVIYPLERKEGIQTEGIPPGAEKGRDVAFPDGMSITPVIPAVKPVPVLPLLPTLEVSEGQKDVITEGDEGRREPEEQIIASAEKELSEERVEEEEILPGEDMTGEPVRKRQVLREDISPQEYNRRVVIFPFENLSDNKDVMKHVLPILLERIEKKGMAVVDEDSLNNFLCQKRIRDTGYISGDLARIIKEEFYASKILTGSIISFSDEENPRFGILARLIDASEGTILWADYAVATGEDFITILNLGRLNTVFSVIPRVMDMLFASFVSEAPPGKAKTSHRIGVMPFKNNSSFKNAGIIAMHMFVIELLKSPEFRPIEYGDVRDEIIRLRIWSRGELNYKNINTLSHELDARGILVGVVDDYAKGGDLSSPPMVGITVRLVNGRNNKILWYNTDQSNGDENLIALDWGRMRSVHTVAYEVVSNLVGRMGTVKWE
ncbi:MAG: hypothetical protein OEM19_07580, partial [Deltaproteobacteria bacterium]|nr:hypothetical protein [Deltaproteobacteria bacterium]